MTTYKPHDHLQSEIAADLNLEVIRYSQVWEDYTLLAQALDIQADDHVLSIGSAGCNVLALLLHRPRRITAIDMSLAQIALMELKFKGIEHLDYAAFLTLWGLRPDQDPLAVYTALEPRLNERTRAYWRRHQGVLKAGVIHAGKLDRFFQVMQQEHLAPLWSREDIHALLQAPTLAAQQAQFAHLKTPAFEAMLSAYLSQSSIAKSGRDPAQFRYVTQEQVGEHFLSRFSDACTQRALRGNHYMEYFLTSTYQDLEAGPVFLRRDNFYTLKGLLDRIDLVQTELEEYLTSLPPQQITKANLSDIFEYMSPQASDEMFALLAEKMRPGGRLAYWNLLVARQSPPALAEQWHHLDELSAQLGQQDRAWFYQTFHVEQRRPEES